METKSDYENTNRQIFSCTQLLNFTSTKITHFIVTEMLLIWC